MICSRLSLIELNLRLGLGLLASSSTASEVTTLWLYRNVCIIRDQEAVAIDIRSLDLSGFHTFRIGFMYRIKRKQTSLTAWNYCTCRENDTKEEQL